MLTKLLRQTQLLDIEGDYQNSSEILDSLYSRIDQSSFLKLDLLGSNLDPLRVDEIVGSILESYANHLYCVNTQHRISRLWFPV